MTAPLRVFLVRMPRSLVHPVILARVLAILNDMRIGGPSAN